MNISVFGAPSDQRLADRIRSAVAKFLKLPPMSIRVIFPDPTQNLRVLLPDAGVNETRVRREVERVCNEYMGKGKMPWGTKALQKSGQ